MKCIVHAYSYTGPRLIIMAQRQQFRSVHSMHYNTKYAATADQTTDQFFDFYFAVANSILPWRILFCREEFYFAVVNCILPWRILFCREEFYFAVKNCILPWRILFCRDSCGPPYISTCISEYSLINSISLSRAIVICHVVIFSWFLINCIVKCFSFSRFRLCTMWIALSTE